MKSPSKRMSGVCRRAAIIDASRQVFVAKGFYGTTTRELAKAAGVSEALLFKHFPDKEALYRAIQESCFNDEGAEVRKRLESLEPSTESLIFLVHDLATHVLSERKDQKERDFLRLVLRSLIDEGEFTRLAIQGGPAHWVKKVEQCFRAACRAGDVVAVATRPKLAGWLVHQLISGFLMHELPRRSVIEYGVSHEELIRQVVAFSLRGLGLKEEALRRSPLTTRKKKQSASTARRREDHP
jgi:AcrR family transcriptional regulator